MAITGAMCTTATDVLDLHMGLWPVHLMLRQVCYRAALRLASLPDAHPLHAVFHKRPKWYIKTHRSPLHEIAALCSSVPELETCGPICSPPASTIKAKITVGRANDAEEVAPIKDDEVQLFSDGSGLDGKVGAAAILYKHGQGPRMLRYSLGSLEEHTVFEAKAIGLVLALHMLNFEHEVQKATLWLDNQAVLHRSSHDL